MFLLSFEKEGILLNEETLLQRAQGMIMSSTKEPKRMILSTVKIADLFGVQPAEVEKGLQELVEKGRLKQEKLTEPPYHNAYFLP